MDEDAKGTTQRRPAGRAGRPPKAPAERRTHMLSVYVNAGELAALERRTAAAGIREVGAYVRVAVMAQRPPRAVVPEVNRGAWGELARTTANVNQIAAHLNGGGRFDERGTARLAQALDALRAEVRTLRLTLTEPTDGDNHEDEDGEA